MTARNTARKRARRAAIVNRGFLACTQQIRAGSALPVTAGPASAGLVATKSIAIQRVRSRRASEPLDSAGLYRHAPPQVVIRASAKRLCRALHDVEATLRGCAVSLSFWSVFRCARSGSSSMADVPMKSESHRHVRESTATTGDQTSRRRARQQSDCGRSAGYRCRDLAKHSRVCPGAGGDGYSDLPGQCRGMG